MIFDLKKLKIIFLKQLQPEIAYKQLAKDSG